MKMSIELILAFLNMIFSVLGDCNAGHGKTTCITEDLLQMLMRVNKLGVPIQERKERIAFLAFVKGIPTTSNNVIKFEDVKTNIGNHYNPTLEFSQHLDMAFTSCLV
ncbi:uncharacterized protein LOC127715591 isoform X1 [Mytilus californianus]|uniref:uncharacterized protein LOC127715591 isoform X1 n=1 Tax=Mytilus californianus TaxID=6549 RepID=UPI0022479C8F|nr:uncharacterized protein LOC127715591 isoform X1 [Mytilus californianus]